MTTCYQDKSRPWDYIQPGVIKTTCDKPFFIAQTTQQESLANREQARVRAEQSTIIGSTVAATITQSTAIASTISGQTRSTASSEVARYRRPEPICVPAEVQTFLRDTANAGVSVMPFRFQDCKGNTYVSSGI